VEALCEPPRRRRDDRGAVADHGTTIAFAVPIRADPCAMSQRLRTFASRSRRIETTRDRGTCLAVVRAMPNTRSNFGDLSLLLGMTALAASCVETASTDAVEQPVATRSGLDFAFIRPSGDTLRSEGYSFAARYLSYESSKNITKPEADDLIAAGLDVVLVWEEAGDAALGGYGQGVSDAEAAQTLAISVGMPATRPIYFAVDFDATPAQQAPINDYLDGIAAVLGRGRTGVYGGYYVVKRAFDAGKIAYGWQTYAWSGGQWDARAQLRQTLNGVGPGGSEDLDESVATDFAQWGHGSEETGPRPPAPPVPTACGQIDPGHGLSQGQAWTSCDHRFRLAMQADGNLVLYSEGNAIWSTDTSKLGGDVAIMQPDGNFVLYDLHSHPLFSSRTNGHNGSRLEIQSDGNVVVYGGTSALWATNTGGEPAAPSACGVIAADHGLTLGESIGSCDGSHVLVLQGDSNLVLYHSNAPLWATASNNLGASRLVMQGDGNLVLYTQSGDALWSSRTDGHPGAYAAIQNDGNFVIYRGSTVLWATATNGR
jgi:hypothetical protein